MQLTQQAGVIFDLCHRETSFDTKLEIYDRCPGAQAHHFMSLYRGVTPSAHALWATICSHLVQRFLPFWAPHIMIMCSLMITPLNTLPIIIYISGYPYILTTHVFALYPQYTCSIVIMIRPIWGQPDCKQRRRSFELLQGVPSVHPIQTAHGATRWSPYTIRIGSSLCPPVTYVVPTCGVSRSPRWCFTSFSITCARPMHVPPGSMCAFHVWLVWYALRMPSFTRTMSPLHAPLARPHCPP